MDSSNESLQDQGAAMRALAFLTESTTFGGLDDQQLQAMIEIGSIRILNPGTPIHRAGKRYQEAVYILIRGEVEIRRPNGDSYRVIPGDIIGLSNYLDSSAYTSTAVAMTQSELLTLPAPALHQLEQEHPTIYNAFNRFIARRIRNWSPAKQAISGALSRPVRTAMRSPLSTCSTDMTLREAFEQMIERKIGSLGVIAADGRLIGMLTFRGLADAVILNGLESEAPVIKAVCDVPHTISPTTPLWKAEEIQQHNGVKYLIVIEDDRPVGMISKTDIARTLITHQTTIDHKIEQSGSLDELGAHFTNMGQIAAEVRESHRQPSTALRVISDTHLALQKRCVELTLNDLVAEGQGEPPIPFALIIMGSGGRQEMMLEPDQDNGIILADTPDTDHPATQAWFQNFVDRLNDNLDRVGYPLCPGEIMARNPMFHKSLAQWKRQITHMVNHPNQKAARWSNIVFDFDTLYGDDDLTLELRKHVCLELARRPNLLGFMVADDADGRPPIGWFNRLITSDTQEHKGTIDIKRNGLRIIADATRIFALHHDIHAGNTIDRLNALMRLGVLSADFVDSVKAAYEELIDLLLVHQIFRRLNNRPIDKRIDIQKLTTRARETLRESMLAVKRLQDLLQGKIGLS